MLSATGRPALPSSDSAGPSRATPLAGLGTDTLLTSCTAVCRTRGRRRPSLPRQHPIQPLENDLLPSLFAAVRVRRFANFSVRF